MLRKIKLVYLITLSGNRSINSSSDLRVFLKERGYESAIEMTEAADRYRGDHTYRGGKLLCVTRDVHL